MQSYDIDAQPALKEQPACGHVEPEAESACGAATISVSGGERCSLQIPEGSIKPGMKGSALPEMNNVETDAN